MAVTPIAHGAYAIFSEKSPFQELGRAHFVERYFGFGGFGGFGGCRCGLQMWAEVEEHERQPRMYVVLQAFHWKYQEE